MTDEILTIMRSLQTRIDASNNWLVAEYVDAFLSGALKDGRYIDPITKQPGTLRTFVDAVKFSAYESDDIRKIELAALAAMHYRMALNYLKAAKC